LNKHGNTGTNHNTAKTKYSYTVFDFSKVKRDVVNIQARRVCVKQ